MAEVFISYKREERPKVKSLVSILERLGLSVWFDEEISAGDPFNREIDARLKAAKAAVVCWSQAAVESDWVHAEADRARSLGIYASVFLEACELPVPFNALHAADLTTWSGAMRHDGLRQLVDKLAKLTGRPLTKRYVEECQSETSEVERRLAEQSSPDEEPEEPEIAPPVLAQHILRQVAGIQHTGSKELSALLAQASFEEEILSSPRTKWVVCADEPAPDFAPVHAKWTPSLKDALDRADEGDFIVVLPGVYRGRFEIKKDVRVVGFGYKEGRPVLTGDAQTVVVELRGSPRIENLSIESRDPGYALQVHVDATPIIVRCVIERQQLAKDHNPALWVSGNGNPTFVACTIWGGSCPAVQFATRGQGVFMSSDIFASDADAAVIQGGCRPQFRRCSVLANGGHAVVSKSNAGATFENCALRASGASTIVNLDSAYSKFIGNRLSVRNGSLVEVRGAAFGRFERNRLEPDPEAKADGAAVRRRGFLPRRRRPTLHAPAIAVSPLHRASFAKNIFPDGSEAKPNVVAVN